MTKDRIINICLTVALIISLGWSARNYLKYNVIMSYKVPSESMSPTINPGDHIIVNRLAYGARLFNSPYDSVKCGTIVRKKGYSTPKRGDIMVFNQTCCKGWDTIGFDIMKYFVKRCVGLPGDTFEIRNAHYFVRGISENLGFKPAQDLAEYSRGCMKNFGPLYLPKKGDTLKINEENVSLYRKIFEWEKGGKIIQKDDGNFYLNGDSLITFHVMRDSYYFMAGDNVLNSLDSRFWGLVPEEFIVGRVDWIY